MPMHPRARGFEHAGDLPRDGEGCVDGNRTLGDAIRERRPLNQFHHERGAAAGLLEAVPAIDLSNPSTPICAAISYGPRRVPEVSDKPP